MSSLEQAESARVHRGVVTGLECIANGTVLASSDAEGHLVFWQQVGVARLVAPSQHEVLAAPVRALCAGSGRERSVYVGLASGVLLRVWAEDGRERLQQENLLFFEQGLTALAWDPSSEALLLGLGDGRLMRWRLGSTKTTGSPEEFDRLHFSEVRHLSLTAPPASGAPSVTHLVSTATDGRVGVWDLASGKPLWGLQDLSASHLLALGDHTRLVCNGVVVSSPRKNARRNLSQSWKDPMPDVTCAPPCEAVLCFDLLGEPLQGLAEEDGWPSIAEKYVSLR